MASHKPKPGQSLNSKAEKKRVEILRAAAKCFRKTGFHQTSMQEICAETGLGPGAVYRYFTGKEAIIEAMAEDERSQARAVLTDMQAADDLPSTLAAVTQAFATRYLKVSDAGLMTEVYAEGLRNKRVGNVVRKTETQWVNGLAEVLHAAQLRGQVDPSLDVRHTTLFLTAMWDGMVIRQAYHLDDKPEVLIGFFEAMLKRVLIRDARADKHGKASTAILTLPVVQAMKETDDAALDVRQKTLL
jgi:AcrR family transcriptional regulator